MASMKGKGKGPKLSDMVSMDDKKKIVPINSRKKTMPQRKKKSGGCK